MKRALLKASILLAHYPPLFPILGLYKDQEISIRMNFTTMIC